MLVQDDTRFLLRHYHTLTNWPLQVHSSALIFSPESSILSRVNFHKIPIWLTKVPFVEHSWPSLIEILTCRSDAANTVVLVPDGRQLASGSHGFIRLWAIDKTLNAPKYLERCTIISHLKFRSWQRIKTPGPIFTIKFLNCDRRLATNVGPIWLDKTPAERQVASFESFKGLYVKDQWIYCGVLPVLRLPPGLEETTHDVHGDQITIGFKDGRILTFRIDRSYFQSTLGHHTT